MLLHKNLSHVDYYYYYYYYIFLSDYSSQIIKLIFSERQFGRSTLYTQYASHNLFISTFTLLFYNIFYGTN
jgi:hypothetical protein